MRPRGTGGVVSGGGFSSDSSDAACSFSVVAQFSTRTDKKTGNEETPRDAPTENCLTRSYASDAAFGGLLRARAHTRKNNGVIARYEKPILAFLAARTPDHISPNQMTMLGLVGAALAFLGMMLSHLGAAWLLLAVAGLVLNWIGDSLDGTIARFRRIERSRYGFFIDHMTDVAAQVLIVLGMGLSPYLRFDLSCLILLVYLSMTIFTLIRLHVDHTLCLTYGGVGPTELRVMLIGGIGLAATLGVESVVVTPYGSVGLYNLLAFLFVIVVTAAILAVVREQALRLNAEDPTPRPGLEWEPIGHPQGIGVLRFDNGRDRTPIALAASYGEPVPRRAVIARGDRFSGGIGARSYPTQD